MTIPPYLLYQPLRKVVERTGNPPGTQWFDELLECGHRVFKVRLHNNTPNAERRCLSCPRLPPNLKGREVRESAEVPYDPGDPAKPGWYFATASGRVAIRPTGLVVAHPRFLKDMRG